MEGEQHCDNTRHCHYFVTKRKRFCRLIPGKGKRFCGEHSNQEKSQTGQTGPERIPCPFDNHHTVAVKQLDKHLKVCNSRPKEQPPFYQKGVNAGTSEGQEDLAGMNLASFSLDEIRIIIAKVEAVFSERVAPIQTAVLRHPALETELGCPGNGPAARKHLLQISSLLGHMTRLGLLRPAACFVEFGAGRGRLSQWVQEAARDLEDTSFLLVDRATVRHKRDTLYQQANGGPVYQRINMDIENLCIGRVPAVLDHPSRPLVAYTKHLCGAATDLALRCLMETRGGGASRLAPSPSGKADTSQPQDRLHAPNLTAGARNGGGDVRSRQDDAIGTSDLNSRHADTATHGSDSASSPEGKPGLMGSSTKLGIRGTTICSTGGTVPGVRGAVMALCCHHRCSWRAYVGKHFLCDAGLSEREFAAMVRMSSWATCGTRVARGDAAAGQEADGEEGKTRGGTKDAKSRPGCHERVESREEHGGERTKDSPGVVEMVDGIVGRNETIGEEAYVKVEKTNGGVQELKPGPGGQKTFESGKGCEGERTKQAPGVADNKDGDVDGGYDDRREVIPEEEEGKRRDSASPGNEQQPIEEGESHECVPERESIVGSLGLSVPEREEIGFKCKRVLDTGRLHYLQSLGLHAQLLYYVERDISPENAVLIATPT